MFSVNILPTSNPRFLGIPVGGENPIEVGKVRISSSGGRSQRDR